MTDHKWWFRYRLFSWHYWSGLPSTIWYNLYYGIGNIIYYAPVIWRDRECDWDGMVAVWEKQFRKRAEYELKYGHHTTSFRDAHNLLVCANLCKRLLSDKYSEPIFGNEQQKALHALNYMPSQDERLLGQIIGKQLRCWWE